MSTSAAVPWGALLPLMIGRFSSAGAYAGPFPFLPSMLRDMGLTLQQVSFWTGFAESCLMGSKLLTAIPMSWLSDRFGRRPVIISTMLWTAFTCVGLGTSSTVIEVICWRLLCGISAMRQVGRVMIGELSNELNCVRMFSVFLPAGTIGTITGRLIGGALAQPHGRIPWLGDFGLLQAKPYLLPLLVMATCPLLGFFLSLRFLKETRLSAVTSATPGKKPTLQRALRQPGLLPLLLAFMVGQSLDHACFAATTLISSVAVADGGLGLNPREIAILLSSMSACYLILAPLLLNILCKRLSKPECLMLLATCWLSLPPLYCAAVYNARRDKTALMINLGLLSIARSISGSCWPFYDIGAIEISSPALLSSTNACLTLFGGAGRLLGPVLFGWVYSLSLAHPSGSVQREFVWILLFAVAAVPLPLLHLVQRQRDAILRDKLDETRPLLAQA